MPYHFRLKTKFFRATEDRARNLIRRHPNAVFLRLVVPQAAFSQIRGRAPGYIAMKPFPAVAGPEAVLRQLVSLHVHQIPRPVLAPIDAANQAAGFVIRRFVTRHIILPRRLVRAPIYVANLAADVMLRTLVTLHQQLVPRPEGAFALPARPHNASPTVPLDVVVSGDGLLEHVAVLDEVRRSLVPDAAL